VAREKPHLPVISGMVGQLFQASLPLMQTSIGKMASLIHTMRMDGKRKPPPTLLLLPGNTKVTPPTLHLSPGNKELAPPILHLLPGDKKVAYPTPPPKYSISLGSYATPCGARS
jgi:hypothetical protein